MTIEVTEAPDIPDPARPGGGAGYPSKGPKVGPAWALAWRRLSDAGDQFTDGRELATQVAQERDVSHETVLGLLSRASRAGLLHAETREVKGTRGIRHRVFYRVNPDRSIHG